MLDFDVLTYHAKIEPHPNADRIELCQIGDYQTIVQKDSIKDGDVVAYIPEASIVPDNLLEELNLTGRLSGKNKNRVKAIKLRGVLSQGLVYPMLDKEVGKSVQEELGIIKYEPPIPVELKGRTLGAIYGKTMTFPLPNIKQFPDELKEGELVSFTEKLHGTWCCCGYYEDTPIVTSKGLSGKGIILDPEDPDNVYSQTWKKYKPTIDYIRNQLDNSTTTGDKALYVLGEIFGRGVQDLQYNTMQPEFRVFDIYLGPPNLGRFLELDHVEELLENSPQDLEYVPILYQGPYSKDLLLEYTNGQSTFGGNIREGLVVRTCPERLNSKRGRACYKSISEKYLLRKGGTEFN